MIRKNVAYCVLAASLTIGCEEIENKDYMPFTDEQMGTTINEKGINIIGGGIGIENDTVFTVGGVSFKMIRVEGGTFMMGSTDKKDYKATPVHQVTLSTYYIGETEVTQELYKAVMGTCPTNFSKKNSPVGKMTYPTAISFANKMKELTGFAFSLPTEAQWEFAARGGNLSRNCKFSGADDGSMVAVYYGDEPARVKSKNPNELGIYDMSGNMQERCLDGFADYNSKAQTDPIHINDEGSGYVVRGGSYACLKSYCTVANRAAIFPQFGWDDIGIRLVIK